MEVLKFQATVNREAEYFLSLTNDEANREKVIRIISHNDTDGITSAAILIKILKRLNLQYWLTNLKVFDEQALKKLANEEWEIAFILDFGLNEKKLSELNKLNKKIFILDHHLIENEEKISDFTNIRFINSYLLGEDLSAAGVVYSFGKAIDEKNKDLAHIAIIGLIGDMKKVDKTILNDALEAGKVVVKKGINIFGASTKPLHIALSFGLPEIAGQEGEAIELVNQAGIRLKDNGKFRTLLDLNNEEMKRLCTIIATRGKNGDFIGFIYLINSNGKIYDAKELATIINACGNLGFFEEGIEACYGNLIGAEKVYNNYRKEIVSALNWFKDEKNNNKVFLEACKGKVWLINAKSNIRDTMIGVLISILSGYYRNKVLIGMAESENKIKISARASEINVKEFLDKLFQGITSECGGHERAAGGLINKGDEKIFIDRVKSLIN